MATVGASPSKTLFELSDHTGDLAIDIEAVVRRGYERTVAANGLQYAALLYARSWAGCSPSGWSRSPPEAGEMAGLAVGPPPVSLGLPPPVAADTSLALGLVSLVVVISGLRTFAGDETERLPREHFTTDIPWTAVTLLVGSIVFGIAVGIGFLLMVVPGLFLRVSLVFWQVVVLIAIVVSIVFAIPGVLL